MADDAGLRALYPLLPAVAGAIGAYLAFRYASKGAELIKAEQRGGAKIYRYAPRARRMMQWVGGFCIAFALLPATLIPYKYFGPEPCGHSSKPCRNKPMEDAIFGGLLFLGFGVGGILCLVDPRKYYARLDEKGVTVNGFFTGLRKATWEEMDAIVDVPSTKMFYFRAKKADGKILKLWVPHTLGAINKLVETAFENGIFFQETLQYTVEIQQELKKAGYEGAKPHRLFLPFLSIWKQGGRYVAVIAGVSEAEEKVFVFHESTAEAPELMNEICAKLDDLSYPLHAEFQAHFATDLRELSATLSQQKEA